MKLIKRNNKKSNSIIKQQIRVKSQITKNKTLRVKHKIFL